MAEFNLNNIEKDFWKNWERRKTWDEIPTGGIASFDSREP